MLPLVEWLRSQLFAATAGKRGSRARWPDLTQTLHPPDPAVACNLDPAGSLSHECGVNSSPASSTLPSITNSSIPPWTGVSITVPGAQRSSRTRSDAFSNNVANSTPGRPGAGAKPSARLSMRSWVRSSGSNCHSLTKIVQPGSASAAVAALALLEGADRAQEIDLAEGRPQHVGEIELAVGALPQQEAGEAHLA